MVAQSLATNRLDWVELGHDVYMALVVGRKETTPVVVLAGATGGEGKSLLLLPSGALFGEDAVQCSPEKGSFPLMGLEKKKVVVMDDWRFNSRVLPLSLQLLWFEGKPMPVVRPQGKDEFSGHVLYRGSAPIFATTPLKHIEDMERAVRHVEADGTGSEWSMLLRRLKIYRYSVRIPKPSKHIAQCHSCLAPLLFQAEAVWQMRRP